MNTQPKLPLKIQINVFEYFTMKDLFKIQLLCKKVNKSLFSYEFMGTHSYLYLHPFGFNTGERCMKTGYDVVDCFPGDDGYMGDLGPEVLKFCAKFTSRIVFDFSYVNPNQYYNFQQLVLCKNEYKGAK